MADDGVPGLPRAEGSADLDVRELSELRDLLFGGERRQLDELRRRFDTYEITPEELAEKLPQAIVERGSRDKQLAIALAPTVEDAISESVRRNPHEIATAIFPVLGPSIRKAIAETMSGLVNTINRAIEHSFSPQGIRWRVESWRTGVPFAQIVMRHSLVYRVEQVFLVHAHTGLLLQHVPENTSEDADLISSMLTAIGDFVNDSFEPRQTGELRAFAAGDLTVLVEPGPQAYLAAVIRGTPPETLPVKLQTTLETIHLQWCNPLEVFDGNAAAFETTRPLLDECVETVLSSDKAAMRKGLRKYAWVFPVVLLIAGLSWWFTRGGRIWNAAVARLDAEPGITVIRSERSGGKWRVSGLRDPLARNPAVLLASRGVDTTEVVGDWSPYISTEPTLLLARARRVLDPPGGVTLSMAGDTLVAAGRAPAFWIVRTESLAPALAGVGAVDLSRVAPGLPQPIEGIATEIERVHVLFATGSSTLDAPASASVDDLAGKLAALTAATSTARYDVRLHVVGRADPTGVESDNLELSRRRATAVRDRLVAAGGRAAMIVVDATGSSDPLPADSPNERARLNRSVSFTVQAQPSTRANGAERVR